MKLQEKRIWIPYRNLFGNTPSAFSSTTSHIGQCKWPAKYPSAALNVSTNEIERNRKWTDGSNDPILSQLCVYVIWHHFPLTKHSGTQWLWGGDLHTDGLVQECGISSALPMEILQSCTETSIYQSIYKTNFVPGFWLAGGTAIS